MIESTRLSPNSPALYNSGVAFDIEDFTYDRDSNALVTEASEMRVISENGRKNLMPCSFWVNGHTMRVLYVSDHLERDREGEIVRKVYTAAPNTPGRFDRPQVVIFND